MSLIKFIIISILFSLNYAYSNSDVDFNKWKEQFKIKVLKNGISEETYNLTIKDTVFLPDVIKYDRYQPEFYEDTKTYISKRTSKNKVLKGIKFYKQNTKLINSIENEFNIDKELLLSLMGIETNFGTYVGKMDILSSLATLSFDKRRSDFFSQELLILLNLIEDNKIDYNTLYGSWAGAFGYFQFMPSTMKNYAIDYDMNNYIDLKSNKDSYASAANYLTSIGWKSDQPCFYSIKLSKQIPVTYLNTSAKNIKSKKKLKYFKKYINNKSDLDNKYDDLVVAIVTPDKDIIPGAENYSPAYIVFNNYEVILKWNRSLRFSLAVCTLKDKFKNEL